MQWTTQQRRALQYFVAHRESGPAVSEYGWKLARAALVHAIAVSVGVYIGFVIDIPGLAWWCIGFGIGTIVGDIRYVVSAARNWPLVAEVTDWDRVSQLAAEVEMAP